MDNGYQYPFKTEKQLRRAEQIRLSLGYRCAAGFLRNCGFSFEQTYMALFGRMPRYG